MSRRLTPGSRRNPLLSQQESAIEKLKESFNARKISGRRNRLLLMLAATSGLPINFVVEIELWQLTYFYELSPNTRRGYPKRQDDVGDMPISYTPLGLYWDANYDRLIPISRSIYKMLRGYAAAFSDHEERSDYLFPVIRKNGNIDHSKHLTVRDAHKILKGAQEATNCGFHHNWHTIRHAAVARLLMQKASIQNILARTDYQDPKSIKDIARSYGLIAKSNPSFTPPRYVGLDFSDSLFRKNVDWYLPELYEYEGW